MSDVVIRAEGIGKRYRLQPSKTGHSYRTLREELADIPKRLLIPAGFRDQSAEEFWPLRGLSFEVKRGEVLGLIGRNGAGKSTLLKILSRIVKPSTGMADIYGRVGSLLEVGTGFHPELTGRENIYLSGAMLGMRRNEVRNRFDEIVAFAEVEKFIDTPCKHYSSGMYMRLGFAVAAHLDSQILLVDEVLAVGDTEFQQKCLGKMGELASGGRTVLFVSHNLTAIRQFCSTGIYLKAGQLVCHGPIDTVLRSYGADRGATQVELRREVGESLNCGIEYVHLSGPQTPDLAAFVCGQSIRLEIVVMARVSVSSLQIAVRISTRDGAAVLTTSNSDELRRIEGLERGRHHFEVALPPFLAPGSYDLILALCDPQREVFDVVEHEIGFVVDGIGSLLVDLKDGRQGCLELPLIWKHQGLP